MINFKVYKLAINIGLLFCTLQVNAGFLVDYQGVEKVKLTPKQLREKNGAPDGYKLFSDKWRGVVHQVGEGKPSKTTSFGTDEALKYALSLLVPENWIVYADEHFVDFPKVSWEAEDEGWLYVLSRIGANNGIRYVVDWDQEIILIEKDEGFKKPDFNQPVIMQDPESGKRIFIYTEENSPKSDKGYILIDGDLVPVKITD